MLFALLVEDAIIAGPKLFAQRATVRFSDCVGGGRVFHPKLLALFHEVYEAFLVERGTPLPHVLRSGAWAAPIAHATLEVLGDIRHGTPLELAMTATVARKNRVAFGWVARDERGGAAVAVAQTVHVFVDPRSFSKIDVPEQIGSFVDAHAHAHATEGTATVDAGPRAPSPLVTAEPRFTRRTTVELADIDAAGVAYFARVPAMFHDAYCAYRRSLGEPIHEYSRTGDPTTETRVDFLRPLRQGDTVDVHVVDLPADAAGTAPAPVVNIGFRITSEGGDALAFGSFTHRR